MGEAEIDHPRVHAIFRHGTRLSRFISFRDVAAICDLGGSIYLFIHSDLRLSTSVQHSVTNVWTITGKFLYKGFRITSWFRARGRLGTCSILDGKGQLPATYSYLVWTFRLFWSFPLPTFFFMVIHDEYLLEDYL